MPEILLTTLNARYAHASFGLRYLMANMSASLRERASMLEFDISQQPIDIAEKILAASPRIVGLGVYIWNADQSRELVSLLKRIRPELIVVIGGPEVSYEIEDQAITQDADYVITGEADVAFGELCQKLLNGERPAQKVIAARLPEFEQKARTHEGAEPQSDREGKKASASSLITLPSSLTSSLHGSMPSCLRLPYDFYSAADIAHRVVYVEASRGCPFKCEFCLSSLDVPVRNAPLEDFLAAMQGLLDRGLRQFKFVDRTFNLNLNFSRSILEFFLERHTPELFLHFEMIPDRLPEALRETIAKFPPGALQFEVGVQTFNDEVSARISRRQDNEKLADNLRFLREKTGVHVHADLIVGLPGESVESFGVGFDRLVALGPQEIQVGMLKRLRGTPIVRHDAEWGMVYSPHAPYEILSTKLIDFPTMQRMRRFSRFWDLIANSGNFIGSVPHIWSNGQSPFKSFMGLSEWLYERTGRKHAIALRELTGLIFEWLTAIRKMSPASVGRQLGEDYQRGSRSDLPDVLKPYIAPISRDRRAARSAQTRPARQARHRTN